jgi:hypothetical protein
VYAVECKPQTLHFNLINLHILTVMQFNLIEYLNSYVFLLNGQQRPCGPGMQTHGFLGLCSLMSAALAS